MALGYLLKTQPKMLEEMESLCKMMAINNKYFSTVLTEMEGSSDG